MPKIVKNGKEYSGVPTEVVTAWQPTGDSVQVAEPLMGNTDISSIGDGTVTGAVSSLSVGLNDFKLVRVSIKVTLPDGTTSSTNTGKMRHWPSSVQYLTALPEMSQALSPVQTS